MKDLYTASETREKLGRISGEQLKRLVEDGKIRKVTPPTNKKRGYYNKEDVDRLAEAMEDFVEIYSSVPETNELEFIQAEGKDDIKETVQIARQNLGDNAYGLEKRMSWYNLAPKGDYVLKHDGIVVGYFSMQAIKAEAIADVFDSHSGRSIQLEDMEPIEQGKPLQLHISGIGVKKGISQKQARQYGVSLVLRMLNMFVELGKEGIEINKVWSKSSTVPGIKLSRELGFTELGYINNEQIGFVLDLHSRNITNRTVKKYLSKYQEALEQWKSQNASRKPQRKKALTTSKN